MEKNKAFEYNIIGYDLKTGMYTLYNPKTKQTIQKTREDVDMLYAEQYEKGLLPDRRKK